MTALHIATSAFVTMAGCIVAMLALLLWARRSPAPLPRWAGSTLSRLPAIYILAASVAVITLSIEAA